MFRSAWQLARETWSEFSDDNAFRLAAALSYYTALALAPLLLVVIAIAGMIFGEQAARGEVVAQIKDLVGNQGAEAVQTMLARSQPGEGGITSLVIGVVILVVGATGVFTALQDALNTVWDVDPKKSSSGGLWGMLKDRLLSFAMVCGLAFLLLVSLAASALMSGLSAALREWLPESVGLLWVGDVLLTVVLTYLLFVMIFKVLPDVSVSWTDVWIGAGITTLLFMVGKYAIGLYLGRVAVGNPFGAAGSFVVLLTWFYYSSLILIFGAEFTHVYATRHGTRSGRNDSSQALAVPVRPAVDLGRVTP
ncbi:MAG TPA: YihY/virulence factor BrkB family protein [Fimbriiglobus sp.]|nr:YihY/virulence factor BrkB family protein [Fimbriiglobus sp.]